MGIKRVIGRLAYRLNCLRLRVTRPLTVGVRLILLKDGQVLLLRHTYHDGMLLPGGGVKKCETLEDAARREAREEVGARLGALRLMGVYTNFYEYKSDHVAVFICEDFELADRPTDRWEIECFAFYPLNALPGDLLGGHRRRLEELARGVPAPGYGMW